MERQNIEFKSAWGDEYLKAIYAFANGDGGTLIIGVDDTGKPPRTRNEFLADVFFKAGLIETCGSGSVNKSFQRDVFISDQGKWPGK